LKKWNQQKPTSRRALKARMCAFITRTKREGKCAGTKDFSIHYHHGDFILRKNTRYKRACALFGRGYPSILPSWRALKARMCAFATRIKRASKCARN
jgi:hypothetical protein